MEEVKENIYLKILKGLGIAFISTLVGILIFSILLTYTNIPEATIPVVIIVISFISILLGSSISTRKISKNGMIRGGIIGGIYTALLYFVSSILNTGFAVNIYTIIMIIVGIVAGLIGGILGINS